MTWFPLTTGFLRDLATGRIDEALSVVDENILYENVGLPTVRGMKRFTRAMHMLNGKFLHFDAEILNAAADGGVVPNERIDLLEHRPAADPVLGVRALRGRRRTHRRVARLLRHGGLVQGPAARDRRVGDPDGGETDPIAHRTR